MPSGARKRKAAKKKKILEANNNPNEHDDSKSQDEKGSDGSEVSSPAQQDHNNNDKHPFSKGDPSGVRSIAPENRDPMEKENQGEKVTEIEWSLKPEKDDEDGSSSSRSSSGNSSRSSSSDDENSRVASDKTKQEQKDEKTSEVVVPVEAEPESSMDGCDVVAGLSSAPAIESVQMSVPVSEETINVVESTLALSSGNDPKDFPVLEAHVAQPSNADSKTLPSQENQASSVGVHPVHKTPWWSCCGMFDVVSGSR